MDEIENAPPRDTNHALPSPGMIESHRQLGSSTNRSPIPPASSERPTSSSTAEDTVVTGAADASQSEASFDVTSPMQLQTTELPSHLGRYEIRTVLGNGAFGTVLKAFDPELDRDVAIKVLRHELLKAPEAMDAYLAEAKALASLDHPGIVPVYDCGRTDDGLCYVVSKFVEGCDLARWMAQENISREQAARLIATVADALHYAHKRGLVHCDIKPANLLVTADGYPIVADFGLAVAEQTQSQESGRIAGTPFYMAPEQARGERHRLDGRADIWALGVILYELVTHRRPFDGETTTRVLDEVSHREPKPPRMIDDTIPPQLERIIQHCLAKDIRERYCTAADLSADLTKWLLASTTELMTVPVGPRASRRTHIALWACVIGAAAAAVSFLLIGQSHKSATGGAVGPTPAVSDDRNLLSVRGTHHPPLDGDVNVRIWSVDKSRRQGLSIHEPGALPLKKDDRIRVEAFLNRPAYVYLIWIAADGQVSPVYPWHPGDWNQPATNERRTGRVSLPEEIDSGWPVDGGPGMETVVLLAREEPLSGDLNLKSMLAGLPKQRLQDEHALVWLDQGEMSTSRTRAPKFFDPAQLDDPVLKTQKLISQRLKAYFPLIRAVSFANKGSAP
jgi:serine/threonine protein kinase